MQTEKLLIDNLIFWNMSSESLILFFIVAVILVGGASIDGLEFTVNVAVFDVIEGLHVPVIAQLYVLLFSPAPGFVSVNVAELTPL